MLSTLFSFRQNHGSIRLHDLQVLSKLPTGCPLSQREWVRVWERAAPTDQAFVKLRASFGSYLRNLAGIFLKPIGIC